MAVMTTTLSNDGVVLEKNTHPVPSSEKMALDLDINGTEKRDETNLDFEIPKPAVIPNVEPPPSNVLDASATLRIQSNEAAVANNRIIKDGGGLVAAGATSVIVEEPSTIAADESEVNKATDADIKQKANQPDETTIITTTPTPPTKPLLPPPAIAQTPSIDTSRPESSFDAPSAATTILPLVKSQESDLREPALPPVSQSQAADIHAAKHAMDLQADPELANGLHNAAGNDVIERSTNGEGQGANVPFEKALGENSIHSGRAPAEGDSQKTHDIEHLQIESDAQPLVETHLPNPPIAPTRANPIAATHTPDADIEMSEADRHKPDAEMDDLFEGPAHPSSGNKHTRPRDEDTEMDDAPEAKRLKPDGGLNGDGVDAEDDADSHRVITPEILKLLRNSIQSARKAKVGLQFKLPVTTLWPTLSGYLEKVTKPMDLTTLEDGLKKNDYRTIGEYKADIHLIYTNCVLFNGPDHEVTKAAGDLEAYLHNKIPPADYVPPAASRAKGSRKSTPARDTAARRPSRAVHVSPPVVKPKAEVYPLDPVSQTPVIRRDSTMGDNGRPKREIHPPKPKDIFTQPATKSNRKKNALELRYCEALLQDIMKPRNHAMNQFFMAPVDVIALNIPHYLNVVKKPMDLGTIQQNLSNNKYLTAKEFEADFRLMLNNCFLFNPADNVVHQKGRDLEKYFNKELMDKPNWMATHAPQQRERHHSPDSEDEQSDEGEEEAPPARVEERLFLSNKVLEEQDKLIKLTTAKSTAKSTVDLQQRIVDMCRADLQKLDDDIAATAKKTKKVKPTPKSTKRVNNNAPPKKPKKPTKPKYIGHDEKEIISYGIQHLDERTMQTVISWIRADVDLSDFDNNEMELDIDSVSDGCLTRLYDLIVSKVPPDILSNRQPEQPEVAHHDPAPAKPKKKNKPMGKSEQESKIAKLKQVVDAGQSAPTAPAAQRHGDSRPGKIMPSIEREEDTSGDEDETDSEEE